MVLFNITKDNYEREVAQAQGRVLLDFWAPWCGHCRTLSPVLDELAKELPSVLFGKVNIDEQPELAERFGVMSIPTLLVMERGKLLRQVSGARPKHELRAMLSD